MKKKIIYILTVCILTILACRASNFSFNDDEFKLAGEIKRNGDFLFIKYRLDGLNNASDSSELSEESRQAISGISTTDLDVVVNCSTKMIKFSTIAMYDLRGNLINKVSGSEWVNPGKNEDIAKISDLCKKVKN